MAKTFYTERDIEGLMAQGVTSLTLNDEIVVTDQARERALKLGFELKQIHDQPPAAPVRPYVAKEASPAAVRTSAPNPAKAGSGDLEARVIQAVKAQVQGAVDDRLLETIVRRVLKSVGGG